MHELGVVMSIVEAAETHADGEPIRRIWLEIGDRSCVLPDAIRFAFDVATRGTLAEGAVLDIIEMEGDGVRVVRMEVG